MDRAQLLQRLHRAWHDFQTSYQGATAADLEKPLGYGEWSIRDIIAHVSIWEEEALEHLPLILAGRPPRYSVKYGGINAFNAVAMEERTHLSLPEVLARSQEVRERLVSFIETKAPEEQLARETRFPRRLRLDTYAHYGLHAGAIRRAIEEGLRLPG